MKKFKLSTLCFPLILLLLLTFDVSVDAQDQKDEKLFYLIIGSGLEYLSYSEYEPDTGSSTDTSLYNVVSKFEGALILNDIFFSIKGVLPVSLGNHREEWARFERIYQVNNLEYSWTRIDGHIGYTFFSWLNPYLGLRWTAFKQERSSFFLSEGVSWKSIEKTRALLTAAGLKGTLKSPPGWQFQYGIEYFIPVSVRTENSSLSGWKASDKDGYSIGARAVAAYEYSPSGRVHLELSGEKAHWGGSDWIDYTEGSAKWPSNETISLNCILGFVWFF